MTNILLTISYDGTDFCGWQRQDVKAGEPLVRTVQGSVEDALKKMLGADISIQGSGRTDSGVHARAQKATFFCPIDTIPEENYVRALNAILPKDVRILKAEKVDEKLSARFSATSRSYRYFMYFNGAAPADRSRYVWNLTHIPNVENLSQMASVLGGEQDFKTFTASGDKSLSTFRYIDSAKFYLQDENTLVFEIEANAFLWRMVRSLTGTLIQADQKGYDKEWFKNCLESCDRTKALVTAPPTGLFLWDVKFDGVRRHV